MHSKSQLEAAVGRYCDNLKSGAAALGCTNSFSLSPVLNPLSLHVCAHPPARVRGVLQEQQVHGSKQG